MDNIGLLQEGAGYLDPRFGVLGFGTTEMHNIGLTQEGAGYRHSVRCAHACIHTNTQHEVTDIASDARAPLPPQPVRNLCTRCTVHKTFTFRVFGNMLLIQRNRSLNSKCPAVPATECGMRVREGGVTERERTVCGCAAGKRIPPSLCWAKGASVPRH